MIIDPWILAFSAATVIATIWMGFWSAKRSKTTHDFFVAGRSVSVGWNASAISGEYLSAASFMGVAGMVMSSGYDALWYPVCYACGYLFLLLFIAGPLRRFGAYTIPDFAEGRFDSPVFRKIAVVFVLFIGFFYTMPQTKGAGTTLAYVFPGLPYWVGVVLVGAVITLNVALGGMKGITLVQAFQYWLKMFAISVPIFALMAVYGNYGEQLRYNGGRIGRALPNLPPAGAMELLNSPPATNLFTLKTPDPRFGPSPKWKLELMSLIGLNNYRKLGLKGFEVEGMSGRTDPGASLELHSLIKEYGNIKGKRSVVAATTGQLRTVVPWPAKKTVYGAECLRLYLRVLRDNGFILFNETENEATFVHTNILVQVERTLPEHAPADATWLNPFGPLTTKAAKAAAAALQNNAAFMGKLPLRADLPPYTKMTVNMGETNVAKALLTYSELTGRTLLPRTNSLMERIDGFFGGRLIRWHVVKPAARPDTGVVYHRDGRFSADEVKERLEALFRTNGIFISPEGEKYIRAVEAAKSKISYDRPLLTNSYGSAIENSLERLLDKVSGGRHFSFNSEQAYSFLPTNQSAFDLVLTSTMDRQYTRRISEIRYSPELTNLFISWPSESRLIKAKDFSKEMHPVLQSNGVTVIDEGEVVTALLTKDVKIKLSNPEDWLAKHERPLALLYTYSLIIALVCGTAGLPHILVRFYTNPDGVAAKRTTMWVMILIGVFYLFPPVFGVMGRNLLPELYTGAGAKGTDKVVLELPRILNAQVGNWESGKVAQATNAAALSRAHSPTFSPAATTGTNSSKRFPWGSILSGITCAGAFAAFMSTFSGLLVSLTGALAHDVYGRMLNPKSTPDQRMRMFKVCAVLCGSGAILLGFLVEKFEINKMVGWAFAIAATSYFPLLFLSTWWRGVTMKGAATGMLAGGTLSLLAIASTMFAEQAAWARGVADFYAGHPLLRILAEQPAIWALPLALLLMLVVSKLTKPKVPSDIRMKMLVLHAPEKLGLKQEYIQEHQTR